LTSKIVFVIYFPDSVDGSSLTPIRVVPIVRVLPESSSAIVDQSANGQTSANADGDNAAAGPAADGSQNSNPDQNSSTSATLLSEGENSGGIVMNPNISRSTLDQLLAAGPHSSTNPSQNLLTLAVDSVFDNSSTLAGLEFWRTPPYNMDLVSLWQNQADFTAFGYSVADTKRLYFLPNAQYSRTAVDYLSEDYWKIITGPDELSVDWAQNGAGDAAVNIVETVHKFLAQSAVISQFLVPETNNYRLVLPVTNGADAERVQHFLARLGSPSWLKWIGLTDYFDYQDLGVTTDGDDSASANFDKSTYQTALELYTGYRNFNSALNLTPTNPIYNFGEPLAYDLTDSQRAALLDDLAAKVQAEFAQVQILTKESLNITSELVSVPITIQSTLAQPIKLKLRISPSQYGITGGVSDLTEVQPNVQTIVEVPIQAIANGSNVLRISMVAENNLTIGQTVTVSTWTIIEIGTLAYWTFIVFVSGCAVLGVVRTVKKRRHRESRMRGYSDDG
jgi:hypothetical protein